MTTYSDKPWEERLENLELLTKATWWTGTGDGPVPSDKLVRSLVEEVQMLRRELEELRAR